MTHNLSSSGSSQEKGACIMQRTSKDSRNILPASKAAFYLRRGNASLANRSFLQFFLLGHNCQATVGTLVESSESSLLEFRLYVVVMEDETLDATTYVEL